MGHQALGKDVLASGIVVRAEELALEAEARSKPLEVEPYRRQLFELFVTAHGAGYVCEDGPVDLTADGLCHELSRRWGLADAARSSFEHQQKLSAEHLSKMRLLWSIMRMWMEWAYAWDRWPEFHSDVKA
jgi:hypothetical protein